MITHSITPFVTRAVVPVSQIPRKDKPTFKNGSPEHREYIHQGTVRYAKETWSEGDAVMTRHRNSMARGCIINIHDEFEVAQWEGLKCKVVEVFWYNNQQMTLHHPSELALVVDDEE